MRTKYYDWFSHKKVTLTKEMRIIELMIYLGVGYRDLVDAPQWVLTTAEIRRQEESKVAEIEGEKLRRQQSKLNTKR